MDDKSAADTAVSGDNTLSTLPRPVSSTTMASSSSTKSRLTWILLIIVPSFFVGRYFFPLALNPIWANSEDFALGLPPGLSDYWTGVCEKGSRWAVPHYEVSTGHQRQPHNKHGKHHEGKHGHHGKHCKHGGPPVRLPWIAEEAFLQVPDNHSARAASRRFTDHAHIAGSGYDFLDAVNLKNEWEEALGIPVSGPRDFVYEAGSEESQARIRDMGDQINVWIDTYYPVMNTPVSSSVTLHTDPPFHAKLREDIVEGDPDSVLRDEVRAFHGLSASGDVTAQYIFAGYGRKKDFNLMQEQGYDFNGKIVLLKYGGVFRGLKVKAAEEAGAVGCLIYSDPRDDGEFTEEKGHQAYPDGPARQPSSVQRGSVQFLSIYPGDPTTPGKPAYRNATRIEGTSMPSIPSLPISYEDALPLLLALNGKGRRVWDFGPEWEGGLGYKGVEYWTGPSDAQLSMTNEVNTRVMPIWNTMATIPGHIRDEVVVVGNHRDAWVLGAADPSSGTTAMYEMIRGLGALLRKGWKPLRTIVLASWDAEEYGLIGSTEWAEDFGDWLESHAAAYLNMDVAVGGSRFDAEASPSLAWLVRNAADDITSSISPNKTVWKARLDGDDWDTWRKANFGVMESLLDENALFEDKEKRRYVRPMGSGSDFTPFLQRFGIAASSIGYAGGPGDPVYHYHSIYDSFTWQDKFADPGFNKHVDAAKIFGLMTLRLADGLVLPINTTAYAYDLEEYLEKVRRLANETQLESAVNFESLQDSIGRIINASLALDSRTAKVLKELRHVLPRPPKKKEHRHCHGGSWGVVRRLKALLRYEPISSGHHHPSTTISEKFHPDEVHEAGWPSIPHPPHPQLPHHPPPPPHHPPTPPPHHPPHAPHIPKKKLKRIQQLLAEVREMNQLRRTFEGGFISEKGIKDREWYRHKGVAPGKWLGYGATTFPALTEAITIDKSAEIAQQEADELAAMIAKMAKRLRHASQKCHHH